MKAQCGTGGSREPPVPGKGVLGSSTHTPFNQIDQPTVGGGPDLWATTQGDQDLITVVCPPHILVQGIDLNLCVHILSCFVLTNVL